MSAPQPPGATSAEEPAFQPYVPDSESPHEFTAVPIIVGTLLGIVFGASSLYLVLKVGLTVSASIPVAVLSITLFRLFSTMFGLRRTTILENNIVQTAGSAGESIAFGVGLILPALLLLGFEIDYIRVMTIGVLGGLLGILLMIPLRRAFIVKQHGQLKYPEGTACAEVLIAGEKGGSMARMIFAGLGLGFVYQFLMKGFGLWKEEVEIGLSANGAGLKGAAIGAELNPALLGVGYIIGPRIASIMVAGGVLAYLVIAPMIVYFGSALTEPLAPAMSAMNDKDHLDHGIIKNMTTGEIRKNYILYIGAGAVAAGGIISMFRALPIILSSIMGGLRDLRNAGSGPATSKRTEQDLPMTVVVFGTIGLVLIIAAIPQLGLGFSLAGVAGALMIVLFGFLFVTVSSRLTGEIGSSSNPISGMTVATLLLTCLVLVAMNEFGLLGIDKDTKLLALTIAGVVCIACANGGTTSQALKTGHLVGATPRNQQWAILIGSLASAAVIGMTLIQLNQAGTTYSKKNLPEKAAIDVSTLKLKEKVKTGMYAGKDEADYFVLNIGTNERYADKNGASVPGGRYLVDDSGKIAYLVDPAVNGKLKEDDNGTKQNIKFEAPKTTLMQLIIDGVLDRHLPWNLVLIGVLIAVTLELSSVPALPFAVGVYLPLASSVPIFIGGIVRGAVDKLKRDKSSGDDDSSPAVLLSSGYIAGGSIAALIVAFLNFDSELVETLEGVGKKVSGIVKVDLQEENWPALAAFGLLSFILFIVGLQLFKKKD